jgi:hypothetical protein
MKFCVYFGGPVLFFFDKVANWMVGVQELLGKLGAAVQMSGPLFYVTSIVCHFLSCIAHVDG